MDNIPRIINTLRRPVTIPVHAYLLDHHVGGQAILPAVIAMQVIGETVKQFRPDTGISVMTRTRFNKFLHLPSGTDQIFALVDIDTYENGDIGARLLTRNRFKAASITRIKEHASVYYPRDQSGFADPPPEPVSDLFSALEGTCTKITPDRIYSELVPFGPAFHSILGNLCICKLGATAKIGTPAAYAKQSISETLGSPFPLDAAYHGACVWGQRYARRVAFPVGFEKRTIWHHTRPEEAYFCRIIPVQTQPDLLVFDVWIYDENGVVFESSLGIMMKDVSAGRMKPPQWIMKPERSEERTCGSCELPIFSASALEGVAE